jgi:hypothetical protein
MQVLETLVAAAALALTFSTPALSQPPVPPVADMVSLSGPRFGGTFLSDGVVKKLKTADGLTVAPFISQFGWQFEKQFYGGAGGPTAVTEAVVLLGARRGASQHELACRRADEERHRVWRRTQHQPRRCCAGDFWRDDVPRGGLERSRQRCGRPVESRRTRECALGIQSSATMTDNRAH